MLTITPRKALSLVAGQRVTVYRHAQISTKLALRILQCHHESTSAGPDRPWASHSITRCYVPSRQEDAHTSFYRRSYYESLPSRPRHPKNAGHTLHHTTITSWGNPSPDAGHPSRRRVSACRSNLATSVTHH